MAATWPAEPADEFSCATVALTAGAATVVAASAAVATGPEIPATVPTTPDTAECLAAAVAGEVTDATAPVTVPIGDAAGPDAAEAAGAGRTFLAVAVTVCWAEPPRVPVADAAAGCVVGWLLAAEVTGVAAVVTGAAAVVTGAAADEAGGAAEAAAAGAVAADTVAAAACVIPDAPELPVTAEATVEVTGWSGEETTAAVPSWAFVPDGSRVAARACRENKSRTTRMPAAINAASIALRAICRDAASDTTCSGFCRHGKRAA
jgi:hypothetical protein